MMQWVEEACSLRSPCEAPKVIQVNDHCYFPRYGWRPIPGKDVDCFERYLGSEFDKAWYWLWKEDREMMSRVLICTTASQVLLH